MAVAMLLFVMVNFHIMPNSPEEEIRYQENQLMGRDLRPVEDMHVELGSLPRQTGVGDNGGDGGEVKYVSLERPLHPRIVIFADKNSTQPVFKGPDTSLKIDDKDQIKKEVERLNQEQFIQNVDKFGLALGQESVVLLVQVHNRVDHFQVLVESLAKVRSIEQVLLIVSHDVFSHELNSVVRNITFCPVLQIFFPYSQQIYYNRFPGEHPNDCPRDIKKEQALEKKCNNAEHPDKYGHYREAKYCQTKHHWIWKLQFVFEHVRLLENYGGHILLLEEDYYVSEDILFSLNMMHNVKKKDCPECRMLVLGNYEKTQNFMVNGGKVERAYWVSSKHNMGMAFSRSLWEEIKKCGKEFCDFDDYNWDWTLQHLSMKCIPDKIRLLKMKASRIFHLGECGGMHTKNKNCDLVGKVKKAEELLGKNKQYLFPNTVVLNGDSRMKLRDPKPNGGWGDLRDRTMCMSFFSSTVQPFLR